MEQVGSQQITGSDRYEFESWPIDLPAMWCWEGFWTSLSLSFSAVEGDTQQWLYGFIDDA